LSLRERIVQAVEFVKALRKGIHDMSARAVFFFVLNILAQSFIKYSLEWPSLDLSDLPEHIQYFWSSLR
jgi:hypothetical protein